MRGPGFQKPLDSGKRKEVRLAVISYGEKGKVGCSCGWSYSHHRTKVQEDAIDRHLEKQHNGRGIRL